MRSAVDDIHRGIEAAAEVFLSPNRQRFAVGTTGIRNVNEIVYVFVQNSFDAPGGPSLLSSFQYRCDRVDIDGRSGSVEIEFSGRFALNRRTPPTDYTRGSRRIARRLIPISQFRRCMENIDHGRTCVRHARSVSCRYSIVEDFRAESAVRRERVEYFVNFL